MRINGILVEEMNTVNLIKHMKTFVFLVPFYFIFAILFGMGGVFILLNLPMEEMWMVPIMAIIGGIIFLWVAISLIRKARYINKVLGGRQITDEEREIAASSLKRLLIGCIAITVILCIVIVSVITGTVGSSGGDYHDCYVCGESGNIKYGSHYYCPTHYAYVKTVVEAEN